MWHWSRDPKGWPENESGVCLGEDIPGRGVVRAKALGGSKGSQVAGGE